jgi:DNA polymerase-3 subunit delta
MILFFYGENDYSLKQKVKDLKAKYKAASKGSFDLINLDGDGLNFENFCAQTQTMALFATTRLIIINQIFDAPKETLDKIKAQIPHIGASSVVVFVHVGKFDKRLGLFKTLNQPKISQHFEKIEDRQLVPFVKKLAEEFGAKFISGGEQYLVEKVGNNLWQLANETQKLATYRSGAIIEKKDIDQMVTANIEANAFALTDAITSKNKQKAFKELESLLTMGEDPFKIMGAINYQMRLLAGIKDELERGVNQYEMASHLKAMPFAVSKGLPIAKKMSWQELKTIYRHLAELDESSKTGKILAEEGLKDLLIKLVG